MSRTIRVALIQQRCGHDRAANLEASLARILEAAEDGAQLVALQELHTGPYFCQCADPVYFDWAEPIPGPTTDHLSRAAAESHVVVIGSVFERRAPGLGHNTAVVLDRDGSLAGIYRKMHIPNDPGYYEKFYFAPGDLGFNPIPTSIGKLGLCVCWDQWFPESARLMALRGADMLVYPTAIGWTPTDPAEEKRRQRDAWMIIQRAHAIANGLPLLAVNRVGFEPDPSGATDGIEFWGSSFVAGPQGEILAEAPENEEAVLLADLDLDRGEAVRRIWPFLRDRRIDAYDGLNERLLDA